MMSENKLEELMAAATAERIVIPAFNAPYLPVVEATCAVLKKYDVFGMVEVARLEITKFGARSLADVVAEYRKYADQSVMTLHLDHVPVIDEDGSKHIALMLAKPRSTRTDLPSTKRSTNHCPRPESTLVCSAVFTFDY